MTCPVEKKLIAMLDRNGIEFRRPERDRSDPVNLDFFLPKFDLYIEVKQFHTDRINRQLASVPKQITVIVLVGPNSVRDFEELCLCLNMGACR